MRYLLLALLLVGCGRQGEKKKSRSISEYAMTCEEAMDGLVRCENHEVVCYKDRGNVVESLQCKFKGK